MTKEKAVKAYTSTKPTTAGGTYTPAGEVFYTDAEPSDDWTEHKAKDAAAMVASAERVPDDANLEAADKAALQAVAIMKHVDIRELKDKSTLITAIKAAYEPKL